MKVLIVGASTGIGFECARYAFRNLQTSATTTTTSTTEDELQVILGCRNAERADAAVRRLRQEFGDTINVCVELLDLASLRTVKAFAQRVVQQYKKLDVLILNAGIMLVPRETTVDGFDITFQTNHLAHFLLTSLLLPLLEASDRRDPRIVVVASIVHWGGTLFEDDVNLRNTMELTYKEFAYCQSKLCNLLFALELSARLRQQKSKVLVTTAHPGWSATSLMESSMSTSCLYYLLFSLGNPLFAQSAERGAQPICEAAFGANVRDLDYYGPDGMLFGLYGARVTLCKKSAAACDRTKSRKLWQISESMLNINFLSS